MQNRRVFTLLVLASACLVACNSASSSSSVGNSIESSTSLSTLQKIEVILKDTETCYMTEDSFKRPTVFAYFSDIGVRNVSKDVTATGYNMNTVGEQEITVSYESLTTSYKIGVYDNEFDFFAGKLASYEGSIKKKTFKVVRSNGYLTTGSDFLEVILEDKGNTIKYNYENSYLLDTNGTASYLNDDGSVSDYSKYQTQRYDDKQNFYQVSFYKKMDWDNSFKKYEYDQNSVSQFYDCGFAQEHIANAKQMKQLDKQLIDGVYYSVDVATNLVGELDDDNIWNFNYEFTTYQIETGGQKFIHSSVMYNTKLTIENGEPVHLEQEYKYTEYYGGVACAYVTAVSVEDYTNGEYENFTGEVLPYMEVEQ